MKHTHSTVGLVSLAVFIVGGIGLAAQRGQYAPPARSQMSGTYELESTRGGDPQRTAQAATRSLPPGQRDRAYQSLLGRLEPPQMLSIDRRGNTVTIESSRGPQSSFDADGRMQRERGDNGRVITTRAQIVGNEVRVSSNGGNRGSDFSVTFASLNNGANLLVTRRLDDEGLRGPVTIQSYYRRTMDAPRWDVYASGTGRGYGRGNNGRPEYPPATVVPDGMRLTASLETPLSMRTSQHGEPFTMIVLDPMEFKGARITGVISRMNVDRGGGRTTDLGVDFQSIEWRGRSSEFDAYLNTIRLSNGSILRLNADGDGRNMNRGEAAVQGGAIGAAVGAIIGAVAGGGKGAAIGAVVGGTGGIILSQGHEQLDLPRGADVTLTAVSPYRSR